MRSTTSARRRHARPARHHLLDALANVIDGTARDDPGHLLVHVVEDDHDLVLGCLPIPLEVHPFTEMAGLTAPAEWSAIGLRAHGTAHHLDGDRRSERITTTYLLHRSGDERSLLRTGDDLTVLTGPAAGTLPDACRRVLGLPTAPAPRTTVLLWTVVWLDRILQTWADPRAGAEPLTRWEQVARLHPAAELAAPGVLAHPEHLVQLARSHAAHWCWARLRAEPERLPLPDGDLSQRITEWMDDGFYARWALGAFPSPLTLARDLSGVLEPSLAACLTDVLEAGLT